MDKIFSRLLLVICIAACSGVAISQTSIGIGVASPHPSAVLEISSLTRGVSFPNVYLTDRYAISPLPSDTRWGTLLYNTNINLEPQGLGSQGFYYYGFNGWHRILDQNAGWATTGSLATKGIGTADEEDVGLWRNNIRVAKMGLNSILFGNGVNTNSSNSPNVVFGSFAMAANTRANDCVAIGSEALKNTGSGNTNGGSGNVAIGRAALYDNIIGEKNTAAGAYALNKCIDSFNTAIGYSAGSLITTGTKNVAIGANAAVGANLTYSVAIGADASVTTNNSVALGGTGTAAVKVGIGVTAPAADLDILQKNGDTAGIKFIPPGIQYHWRLYTDNQGNFNFYYLNALKSYINGITGAFVDVSDARLKKDVADIHSILRKTMQLSPKSYRFRETGESAQRTYGFLAQEVEKLFPAMVATHPVTGMKSIAYQDFGVVAIQTIKEQQDMLQQLDQTFDLLSKKLSVLEKKSGK